MSLLRRAVHLNDASWTLATKYTYALGNIPAEKVMARSQLGEMASEIVDDVAKDSLKKGIGLYLQYLGWRTDEIMVMLNGPQMDTQQNSFSIIANGLEEIQGSPEVPIQNTQVQSGQIIR